MSKKQDRIVFRNENNQWVNKLNSAGRASSIHDTQREATVAAKSMLTKQGGGELIVKGRNGTIRSKDTVSPGKDPFPPRDREH
jgi:hypothetical protein